MIRLLLIALTLIPLSSAAEECLDIFLTSELKERPSIHEGTRYFSHEGSYPGYDVEFSFNFHGPFDATNPHRDNSGAFIVLEDYSILGVRPLHRAAVKVEAGTGKYRILSHVYVYYHSNFIAKFYTKDIADKKITELVKACEIKTFGSIRSD